MKFGLLWYDDSRMAVEEKIDRAAQRYYEKFGVRPNVCYINPKTLNGDQGTHKRVKVVTATNILPDHFWIGVAEPKKQ